MPLLPVDKLNDISERLHVCGPAVFAPVLELMGQEVLLTLQAGPGILFQLCLGRTTFESVQGEEVLLSISSDSHGPLCSTSISKPPQGTFPKIAFPFMQPHLPQIPHSEGTLKD